LLAPRESGSGIAGPAQPIVLPEGSLHLFTYPLLVDEGRLSEGADELKAALGEEPFLEIHVDDAAKRGVADGATVVVRTSAGEVELPVRVTEHIARGTVFVPFNQPGFAANTLLAGSFTIAATVEAVGTETAPQPVDASVGGEG
jgi:anaerobic selenocysteine-containing dehydrogenase